MPIAALAISTQKGTVAPGEIFSYALAFHNAGKSNLPGTILSLRQPPGTTIVSADGSAGIDSEGVLHWPLGTVAAGATESRHVTLKAATGKDSRPFLPILATLTGAGGNLLAEASESVDPDRAASVSRSILVRTAATYNSRT